MSLIIQEFRPSGGESLVLLEKEGFPSLYKVKLVRIHRFKYMENAEKRFNKYKEMLTEE